MFLALFERDLTLSAEHSPGGYVLLTQGIHDRPPSKAWHFETTAVHAASKEMRNLAAEIPTFLTSVTQQPEGLPGPALTVRPRPTRHVR